MKKIGLIDYGMGNIHSVKEAIENLNEEVLLINHKVQINHCKALVIPGQGAFDPAVENLTKTGLIDAFTSGPSKAALHHLTRVLAASLVKENIIVNAIAPGPFPTWMLSTGVGGGGDLDIDWAAVGDSNPRGRVGTPEDIAGLAIFLCSRAGAYTVGETITCDGGAVASS